MNAKEWAALRPIYVTDLQTNRYKKALKKNEQDKITYETDCIVTIRQQRKRTGRKKDDCPIAHTTQIDATNVDDQQQSMQKENAHMLTTQDVSKAQTKRGLIIGIKPRKKVNAYDRLPARWPGGAG